MNVRRIYAVRQIRSVAAVALVVPINGFSTRESTLQRVLYYLLGL